MSDPIGCIDPGPPCPACGHRVSLGKLDAVLAGLRARKAALPKTIPPIAAGKGLSVMGGKTLNVSPGRQGLGVVSSPGNFARDYADKTYVDGIQSSTPNRYGPISIDGEICANCGTFWKPDAKVEADSAMEEIRKLRLELESAVDLLGRVTDD